MAQKRRTGIDQSITANVYDNNQKEILAAMVREVLADFRDSYFNLLDDKLQGLKFNDTQTLQQYLDTIAGSVPKSGTVLNVDVAGALGTYSVDGIISSASMIDRNDVMSVIEINFTESISGKRIIPILKTRSQDSNSQKDITPPVVRVISSTRINIIIREVFSTVQALDLEIIIL